MKVPMVCHCTIPLMRPDACKTCPNMTKHDEQGAEFWGIVTWPHYEILKKPKEG